MMFLTEDNTLLKKINDVGPRSDQHDTETEVMYMTKFWENIGLNDIESAYFCSLVSDHKPNFQNLFNCIFYGDKILNKIIQILNIISSLGVESRGGTKGTGVINILGKKFTRLRKNKNTSHEQCGERRLQMERSVLWETSKKHLCYKINLKCDNNMLILKLIGSKSNDPKKDTLDIDEAKHLEYSKISKTVTFKTGGKKYTFKDTHRKDKTVEELTIERKQEATWWDGEIKRRTEDVANAAVADKAIAEKALADANAAAETKAAQSAAAIVAIEAIFVKNTNEKKYEFNHTLMLYDLIVLIIEFNKLVDKLKYFRDSKLYKDYEKIKVYPDSALKFLLSYLKQYHLKKIPSLELPPYETIDNFFNFKNECQRVIMDIGGIGEQESNTDVDVDALVHQSAAPKASSSPWVAEVDDTTGYTYYFNKETDETSWNNPDSDAPPIAPPIAPQMQGTGGPPPAPPLPHALVPDHSVAVPSTDEKAPAAPK
jgi:hypothetical protein